MPVRVVAAYIAVTLPASAQWRKRRKKKKNNGPFWVSLSAQVLVFTSTVFVSPATIIYSVSGIMHRIAVEKVQCVH